MSICGDLGDALGSGVDGLDCLRKTTAEMHRLWRKASVKRTDSSLDIVSSSSCGSTNAKYFKLRWPIFSPAAGLSDSRDEHAQPMPFHSPAEEPSRPDGFGGAQEKAA